MTVLHFICIGNRFIIDIGGKNLLKDMDLNHPKTNLYLLKNNNINKKEDIK